jgi:hypothetical protein
MERHEIEALELVEGETLKVRGENGAEYEQDVPVVGSVQREIFEDALHAGRLTIIDRGEARADAGKPAESAKVGEWREYAVSRGLDPAEVKKTSKEDLIALLAADEPEPEAVEPLAED